MTINTMQYYECPSCLKRMGVKRYSELDAPNHFLRMCACMRASLGDYKLKGGIEMEEQTPRGGQAVGYGPQPDNWMHRHAMMKCRTCMWWVKKRVMDLGPRTDDGKGDMGRCRRHAPTMSGFPAVYASDWCGDHKIDETKT